MNSRKDLARELVQLRVSPAARGRLFWRSLEEASGDAAFEELMRREFPEQASVWPDSLSRRKFLTLMGASLALAGISGCTVRPAPSREIVPYVHPPEEIIPGKPLFYATSMSYGGSSVGLLVESHMGRPTKIEGNPDHPDSRGTTGIFQQAAVLGLYDPDRSQTVNYLGQTRTWEEAAAALRGAVEKQRPERGAGVRILTGSIDSPTLIEQLQDLLKQLPEASWHVWEPLHADGAYQASQMAFDRHLDASYDFAEADVIVSLGADFLVSGPAHLRHAREFIDRRRVRTAAAEAKQAGMNRLYVVETSVSCTGAKADHRLPLRPSQIAAFARALGAKLGVGGTAAETKLGPEVEKWLDAVADDLRSHRGRSLVIAGPQQPPQVALVAHALNERLENVGKTVYYAEPIAAPSVSHTESLRTLVDEMEQGRVDVLLLLGTNPVLTAPADLNFVKHLQTVPTRVHLGLYEDETSRQCHWHLPEAHFLETWSDGRGEDGTASIAQPLIEPLYHGRSMHEVIALMTGTSEVSARDLVRDHWRRGWKPQSPAEDFDTFWKTCLHDGVVPDTQRRRESVRLADGWQRHLEQPGEEQTEPATHGLELVIEADPMLADGRFANNGWLQELPKPVTKLTWGNAAIMSPKTAGDLGIGPGNYAHGGEHGGYFMPVVEMHLGPRVVRGPVWIMPGCADETVVVYLGNGRSQAGRVGGSGDEPVGFNAYPLRTADHPWFAGGLKLVQTGERELVACTQQHHSMEEREPVRIGTLAEYREHPHFAQREEREKEQPIKEKALPPLTLYEPFDYSPPKQRWAMTIDLTACIGCKACVIACQAENNIPVVGKQQVAAGREMHWIRVDRYVQGTPEDPRSYHFQPVPCMHCENAPCEYVCPVEATVHSAEGLNDMVYNRCVGTRFCSNNCPYKVRRFNFFEYADFTTPTRAMQYNPDVTVRSRGVMEKCSYCVQRIRHAEIDAQTENRPIADGEVLTACQAVCPTQAIVFGDMNDPQSSVKKSKASPLHYGLLEDLNTLPRTTYLAELRNPNPRLEAT